MRELSTFVATLAGALYYTHAEYLLEQKNGRTFCSRETFFDGAYSVPDTFLVKHLRSVAREKCMNIHTRTVFFVFMMVVSADLILK